MVTFLYPWVLIAGLILLVMCRIAMAHYRQPTTYQFPLTHLFHGTAARTQSSTHWATLLVLIRWLSAFLLVLGIARPQYPDKRSKITVEGIATMLVLDVSGSMASFDDLRERKTRFAIVQEEAIKFIERRDTDLMGLVVFGAVAASRCPLTADKKILIDCIKDTKIGVLNHDGTMLSMAMALGINRLRGSECETKIMVLLTDGEPSPGDLNPQEAVTLAKKAGIKIYTIGIGSDRGGFMEHPQVGTIQVAMPLNENLLRAIAAETGGMFFRASDQKELERIYAQIDKLEKSSHETPVYRNYYELAIPLLFVAFFLLVVEILITAFFWVVI